MILVGSKGAFRAHQEHVLLELRSHQKHVLLQLRAQQTAHFDPKVLILSSFIIFTVYKVKIPNLKYYMRNFFRRKIYHFMIVLKKIPAPKKKQKKTSV